MTELGFEFIRTKLNPPSASHPWIPLDNLVPVVTRIVEVPLTLVTAPAGFGKTTQLALWYKAFSSQSVTTAWLTIDADDDDVHLFFAYLLEAFAPVFPDADRHARELIRNDPLLPYRRVLPALLNGIAAQENPVVLFLDDVHLLESAAVCELLFRMIRYAPPNLHVVMAGRTEPDINVSRFRSQRKLLSISTDDLRFSEADIHRFFLEVIGRPLSSEDSASLLRATEGWVAGIQLASISRSVHEGASGYTCGLENARHEISAYLNENVLGGMPDDLVSFMLQISVPDRISGALAVQVTGNANAAAMLNQLAERNFFHAPLDEQREWYRFHALLLDYLRARAAREIPGELPGINDRVSDYFAAEGWWQEAVRHALAAGQDLKAARWVESCADDLIRRSALRTVICWLGRLPEHVIRASVRLRLAQAWAYSLGLQPVDAARTLSMLQHDLSNGTLSAPDDEELNREILAVRAIIAGLTDDSLASLKLGRAVLSLRPEAGSWVEHIAQTALVFGLCYENGHDEIEAIHREAEARRDELTHQPTYASVYQESMFGLGALLRGHLVTAHGVFLGAMRRGEDEVGFNSAAATLPAGYLSTLVYEWDEIENLSALLKWRLPIALSVCANGSASRFSVSLIRLQMLDGHLDQAFSTIKRASRVARERGWLRLLSACQAEAIRGMLLEGDVVRAHRTLDVLRRSAPRRTPVVSGSSMEVRFNITMSMARVMMATANYADARIALDDLCHDLAALNFDYHLAQARILLAEVELLDRQDALALSTLGQAVAYGKKQGMIRSFVDGGPAIAHLLNQLRTTRPTGNGATDIDQWYLASLTSRMGASGSDDGQGDVVSKQDLRPREAEIMALLAQGLSNKVIAQRLSISPETVKWHLKNIFRKMGVRSRTQAVRKVLEEADDA